MKKALIVLIVLAVLVSAAFGVLYFVFTADHMKSWGDDALADGNIDRAVMWYEYAVQNEPENVDLVLALVDANLADNNFTHAERNLVKAIQRKPDAALYAKLSAVYVMQDKLMDAQIMLDGIADAAVRAELDALRPDAPVVTPEGGEYHDLISVTMTSPHTIYYSLSDRYPSTADAPYAEPLFLDAGTSSVRAIAVSHDGLVSPLFETSYLLVGVVQEIRFASPELETIIRDTLCLSDSEAVLSSDLWSITELELPAEITVLSDLQYFENLESLVIRGSSAEDYSFLSKLFALKTLDVSGSAISAQTLKYIGLLPELTELNLSECGLTDISSLANATSLVTLDLSNNSIQDISALEELSHLETLNLQTNAVNLLSSLSKMPALRELNIANNNLSTLAPLENSKNLVTLIADNNQLMDVGILVSMDSLEYFTAANNRIADVSCLVSCTKLTYLDLSHNRLSSIDAMAKLVNLTYIDISHNSVTALPELPMMEQLQTFYASYNSLTSVVALSGQPLLAYVNLDYNAELTDVTCLADCAMLVRLDVFGTQVSDIQSLLDMSVIVNYDPSAIINNSDEQD